MACPAQADQTESPAYFANNPVIKSLNYKGNLLVVDLFAGSSANKPTFDGGGTRLRCSNLWLARFLVTGAR